ncbi:cyclic nucleotide-gated channel rod photoreceptor subunit alpha-like isoform X2 [Eriocheir sinensis]|uniref:cyclic nucleotide-gated channel rod photoreceptor subunit alpha-like isoform X2 n=1 Tax=Eriocheir sinensis TaxID=95602 RepID=UPI0021CA83E9|nr:cyclic nucleotide-gated channel rod photoreceptor subunit alpha-like isoform X2 [Eriocheir sinensis]
MSGRRMWGLGGKRLSSDGGRVRYSSCRPASQDDLEDIAVVFHADPGQVKYGSGPITANGPRVIPGIIRTQRSVSGGRLNTGSPLYLEKASPAPVPSAPLKGKSLSRQSLIDVFSSRISIGSRKRFSRDSFSASYVNRTQVASELDVSKKTREARRKKIKNFKVDKWESSTSSSDRRQGCRWTFVFDPAGRLCYYWSLIVSLAFLYNLWVMVYRFAFQEITGESILVWFALDYFADLIYVVDILFHFRTGYLEDGVLQTDSRKLRQHYMNSTTFYVDCLCLLPLDILYLSIGFKSILRCFRLVKIYKYWHFLDRTERHTNSPNLFRSVSLIHYLLVIFHWNACLFHIIARNDGFTFRPHFLSTNGADGVVLEYLRVFYWCTLSLTTIGGSPLHDATPAAPPPLHHSPGTPPTVTSPQDSHNGTQDAPTAAAAAAALNSRTKTDYLYNIAQLMFGLLLFATVLGHIANIVTNVSAARKEFQAKLDGVKTYMRMRRVPAHLQAKVIKWFDYLWLTQKCSDEERAVSCLPDKLKAEMAIHVHLDTLKRVEIFQNTEAGFLCELVLHLRPVLFSPGDYICRKGEVGKEMYIVNRGRLQVVADNGKTMLATLKAGSYFGEISILNMGTAGNRRTASVRSVGYSDLFVLSKKDMWDVLKEYPAARVRLEAIAAKRLEKYKKAPLEKAAMGRSSSTPGLVESSGRVPLEEMWLPPIFKPPQHPPCTPAFTPSTSPRTQAHRSQTLESERLTMESGLSDASSRQSTDEDVNKPTPPLQPPLHHPLYHPQPPSQPPPTQPPLPPSSSSSSQPIGILQGSHSAGALPRDSSPQELLLGEIRRLRERLVSLEAENASMTLRLSQQQWQVEHRLHEIELQLCPNSSTASSGDDSERNRESII